MVELSVADFAEWYRPAVRDDVGVAAVPLVVPPDAGCVVSTALGGKDLVRLLRLQAVTVDIANNTAIALS